MSHKAGRADVSFVLLGGAQAAEAAWFEREGTLRREVAAQEERLRSLEVQKAELAAASADGTRPLLRYACARSVRPATHLSECGLAKACLSDPAAR